MYYHRLTSGWLKGHNPIYHRNDPYEPEDVLSSSTFVYLTPLTHFPDHVQR